MIERDIFRMIVKFQTITFQNILSFGACPTSINFSRGINLISGKNGSGKSAVLDALSFCLYGQPYRKIKIKDLVNRKNKKNLKVTCNFTIDSKEEYTISRSLMPDKIEIIKNGEELELLSSKRLNQEEIDKIIGINYHLFKQVISLAVNYNRPFLSMSAMDKRDIIEQIFNIKIFGQMLRILKKNNIDVKTRAEVNTKELTMLTGLLKTMRRQHKEMTDAYNNFQENKENDLREIDKRIRTYLTDKIKIIQNIEDIEQRINQTEYDKDTVRELKIRRNRTVKEINQLEYVIKTDHKTIISLDENDICPLCKTNITNKHRNSELKKLKKSIKENEIKIKELKKTKKELDDSTHQQESWYRDWREFKLRKENMEQQLKRIENELDNAEDRRNEILNRELDINLESLTEEFESKKEDYTELWNTSTTIQTKIKNNDIVSSILSESGIKAFFFKKLIPILNVKVNEYIKLFELPVILQFDEYMNERIFNLNNLREEISYYSYSEGEKKRLDMSILLSFINITKTISNWNCNVLMIDELLDSAIDENGLEKMVSSLKSMTYDTKDLCIYIISHRLQQDYSSQFSSCLNIQKNVNSFSEICLTKGG